MHVSCPQALETVGIGIKASMGGKDICDHSRAFRLLLLARQAPCSGVGGPTMSLSDSQRLPPLRGGRRLLWATLRCPRHHHLQPSCPGLSSSAPGSVPSSAKAEVGDRDSGEKPGSLGCRPEIDSASQAVHQLCPPGLTLRFLGG